MSPRTKLPKVAKAYAALAQLGLPLEGIDFFLDSEVDASGRFHAPSAHGAYENTSRASRHISEVAARAHSCLPLGSHSFSPLAQRAALVAVPLAAALASSSEVSSQPSKDYAAALRARANLPVELFPSSFVAALDGALDGAAQVVSKKTALRPNAVRSATALGAVFSPWLGRGPQLLNKVFEDFLIFYDPDFQASWQKLLASPSFVSASLNPSDLSKVSVEVSDWLAARAMPLTSSVSLREFSKLLSSDVVASEMSSALRSGRSDFSMQSLLDSAWRAHLAVAAPAAAEALVSEVGRLASAPPVVVKANVLPADPRVATASSRPAVSWPGFQSRIAASLAPAPRDSLVVMSSALAEFLLSRRKYSLSMALSDGSAVEVEEGVSPTLVFTASGLLSNDPASVLHTVAGAVEAARVALAPVKKPSASFRM